MFRQALFALPDKKSSILKRSMSHMDVMENVEPVFQMQAISCKTTSDSVDNISRLRNSNTNLINGYYSVSEHQ